MSFDALLDNTVVEEALFSEDLWRDDYEPPSLVVEEKQSVGFATLYKNAQEYYAEILRLMDMPRVCVYCKTRYYEKDNVGQLRCAYHPFAPREGERLCCASYTGCTPCDHTSQHPMGPRWTEDNKQVKIPTILRSNFHYSDSAVEQTVENVDPLCTYDLVNRIAKRL
jgi:hypothetical protein